MKRFLSKINSAAAVLLAIVFVLMLCFVAARNNVRRNLSGQTYYELSEKTLNLLKQLEKEVKIIVFFQREHDLYDDIENLLEEYQYRSRNISVEWVDPARDLALVEKYAGKYDLQADDAQVVVFDVDGHKKIVRQGELAEYRQERGVMVRSTFKGERAFSSAIQGLTQGEVPVVRFLVGHGEKRASGELAKIGGAVVRDNLEIHELLLSGEAGVPDGTAALIVAGPTKRMSSDEVDMIKEYLDRGGRVLLMLDALKETGLEPMLRRWGVGLRDDYVVDPENTLRGSDVHVRRYNTAHPIASRMTTSVRFILPRSVMPLVPDASASSEDRPSVVPLFFTSERSWSETQVREASARFDPNTTDFAGNDPNHRISLGLAVERGARRSKVDVDVQIKPSRLVVIGDSDFVSNAGLVGGNEDLFMSSLNWLLEREELLGIASKTVEEVRLSLSRKDFRTMSWVHVGGVPAVAMVIGLVVWARRRK